MRVQHSVPRNATHAALRKSRPRDPKRSFGTGVGPEVLARLDRREINLVSWRRPLPERIESELGAWVEDFPAEFEALVSLPRFDLSAATRGLSESLRAWMLGDIAELLARFAQRAGASRLRVAFGAIRTNRCTKFHMDYVRYRLITTYLGPGTEWVPEGALRREALEHARSSSDANREIVRVPGAVRRAAAGEVIVMKGARHEHGCGAVHRSPAIESTGRVRVALIASTLEDA